MDKQEAINQAKKLAEQLHAICSENGISLVVGLEIGGGKLLTSRVRTPETKEVLVATETVLYADDVDVLALAKVVKMMQDIAVRRIAGKIQDGDDAAKILADVLGVSEQEKH